jgi:hypothetical protein
MAVFSLLKNTLFSRFIFFPELHCSVPYIFSLRLPPNLIFPARMSA